MDLKDSLSQKQQLRTLSAQRTVFGLYFLSGCVPLRGRKKIVSVKSSDAVLVMEFGVKALS